MPGFARRDDDDRAELSEAWQKCEAGWDDPRLHERFCALVSARGEFALGARRYRDVLTVRPDDPVATERCQRLRRMAEAALLVTTPKVAEPVRYYRNVILLLLASAVLIVGGWIYTLMGPPPKKLPPGSPIHTVVPRRPPGPTVP
jgi:hypothetical protein